jgi:hypothetical protein
MSVDQLNTLATAAITAMESGDYAGAIRAANSARILLSVAPNLSRSAAGNAQTMGWGNVTAIDSFIAECRKLQSQEAVQAGGPLLQTKVRYSRAGMEGGF